MRCVFCKKDPDIIVLVPFRTADGALESFACLQCSKEAGMYCDKHNSPHSGFAGDHSHACLRCIEEDTQSNANRAAEITKRIRRVIDKNQWDSLLFYAHMSSDATGDRYTVSLLRFVFKIAHRQEVTLDEVVSEIERKKDASILLPSLF